jgi:hypothetical protein
MMDGAASGRWENYCVAGEHMFIADLFFSKKVKLALCLINYALCHEDYEGVEVMASFLT